MMTLLDASESDPVLYTDCSDVPYTVTLSDTKNFEVESRTSEFAFFSTVFSEQTKWKPSVSPACPYLFSPD